MSMVKPPAMTRRPVEMHRVPASFAQQRLWFFDQLAPELPLYHVPIALEMNGALQIEVLHRACQAMTARHETWRTTFSMQDGVLSQVIAPDLTLGMPVTDLSALPREEQAHECERRIREEALRPFDLERGPLVRISLLRLAPERHVLLLTLHHIIHDGWSFGIIMQELAALYEADVQGRPSPLAELPIQYADYTLWQREWMKSTAMEQEVAYWRTQLEGAQSVLDLLTDHPRPLVQRFRGAIVERVLPIPLREQLKVLSRQKRTMLSTVVMAGFAALMHRYTGQEDLIVGTVSANRNRTEIEPLLGFFVNLLPIRTRFTGDPTFSELLVQVRMNMLGALTHQNLPFEQMVEMARGVRAAGRVPLVQVACAMRNYDMSLPAFGGVSLSFLPSTNESAAFELGLECFERADGLVAELRYDRDLFDQARMERLLGHLERLLEAVVADPQQRISEIPILMPAEREQMLVSWNQTDRPFTPATLHGRFAAQVARTPDAVAAVFEGQSLTYRALAQQSNRLAHRLRDRGVGPGVIVGICMERSLEMVVGLFAIFKAGGAYLPIDPALPLERRDFMLQDAAAPILLTQRALLQGWAIDGARTLCMDEPSTRDEPGEEEPHGGAGPENLAYVIYTSGSTGKPKGVLIAHQSAVQFAEAMIRLFEMGPADRVLQFGSLSFDVSVFEIFSALLSGATLCLAPREVLLSVEGLTRFMQEAEVTVITVAPAMMNVLPSEPFPHLRLLAIGSEAYPGEVVNRWALPGRRFYNCYGPTEATVAQTAMACVPPYTQSPPIGRPLDNHRVYLLDQHLNPVPVGVAGELYISGAGLAWGYLNRPELTSEKFLPNPFVAGLHGRMYRTGDLAYWLPDGNLEFLGRADRQVKIRGFRIEIGEIEAELAQHPHVQQVVVVAREERTGQKRLVAYVVPTQEAAVGSPLIEVLQTHLRARLPEYMVPSAFCFMSALPLTNSGKIDHGALPAPSETPREANVVAPRTRTEAQLARLWGDLLGQEQVGVHDHFFEQGGHSLLAIQLIMRIEQACGIKIPLQAMLLTPTVEGLAEQIDRAQGQGALPTETDRLPLVAMRKGTDPPLFCLHPVGGSLFGYIHLIQHLPPDLACWGFEAPGLHGEQAPCSQIEALATYYIGALRKRQQKGPYQLSGWSMGGLIAYEMARQLQAAGEEVALLLLIDTLHPDFHAAVPDHEVMDLFTADIVQMQGGAPPALGGEEMMQRLAVFRANATAAQQYKPGRFDGQIKLIRSQIGFDPDLPTDWRWGELVTQGVEVFWVPGDHYTILQPPAVKQIAEHIAQWLSRPRS